MIPLPPSANSAPCRSSTLLRNFRHVQEETRHWRAGCSTFKFREWMEERGGGTPRKNNFWIFNFPGNTFSHRNLEFDGNVLWILKFDKNSPWILELSHGPRILEFKKKAILQSGRNVLWNSWIQRQKFSNSTIQMIHLLTRESYNWVAIVFESYNSELMTSKFWNSFNYNIQNARFKYACNPTI